VATRRRTPAKPQPDAAGGGPAAGRPKALKSGRRESNPHHQLGRLRFYH
jgi:hypothetical protein